MKKIIIFTIILSIMASAGAYATVGVNVFDPGALTGEFAMEPYAETLNTTRYAPWFLMYHMWSEKEKEMGRRAGEGGQIVMCLAKSPVNPNLMLQGNDTCGLWRSEDGGQNWYAVNNNVNMWTVADAIFDPNDANTAYIVQTYYGEKSSVKAKLDKTTLYGVYKSTDAGKTWVQVLEKRIYATNKANHLLAFDASGALYALTSEGVMKTTNGGTTWQQLGNNANDNNVYDMRVSPDGQTIITASAGKGITVSFNGGATWQQRNGSPTISTTATSIAVIPADSGDHWMAVFTGKGLYQSFNRGTSWTKMSYPSINSSATPEIIEVSKPRSEGSPTLYLVYRMASYPFRYSTDLGATWKAPTVNNQDIFGKGITGYYAEGICVDPIDPDTVYFSFGDIVYKSTDRGANFNYISSGFSGNYANDYVFDGEGKIYFPFTDKGLGVTNAPYKRNEYPTAKMFTGTGRYKDATTVGAIGIDPRNPNHMIIALGTWSEQILKQTWDGGQTWSEIPGTGAGAYERIVFHPTDANIIYTTHFTSRDGGSTWTKNSYAIWDVSKVNPSVVWGKIDGYVARSTNGGQTWTKIVSTSDAKAIKADLFDVNVAWVGCYNGTAVKVVVGGSTVTMGESNGLIKFDGNPILLQDIAQNPLNPLHIVAGGRCTEAGTKSPGLYETLDGGNTWTVVPGLPGPRTIETLVFSKNTREVFIGGYTGTIIYEYDKFHDPNFSYDAVFSKRSFATETTNKVVTAVGVIDRNNPNSNVYESRQGSWPDQIGTVIYNGTEYDKRIFYKADIKDILAKGDIISAKLVINERRMNGTVTLGVYKVTSDWNMSTISYNNAPSVDTSAIVFAPTQGYQDYHTAKELDITGYAKTLNAENSVVNVMLKATGQNRADLSHIHGINSYNPPYIKIVHSTFEEEKVESLISDKIYASHFIELEGLNTTKDIVPILVLYNGKRVEKIVIGDKQTIAGSGYVKADIALSGISLGGNHRLKMILVNDIINLSPVSDKPGVLQYAAAD